MNKQNKNKLIDTDNRKVVTSREGGGGKIKWVKGAKYMLMDGNWTFVVSRKYSRQIPNYNGEYPKFGINQS